MTAPATTSLAPGSWDDVMLPNYPTPPVTLTHGSGSRVTDTSGRTYTDLLAGIAVNILGHAHPAFVRAVAQQAGRLAHTSNLYANEPALRLATRLRALLPGHRAFFCNSGTEANEAALKTIRRHAREEGRQDDVILAFEKGFHGRSMGSLALTGQPHHKAGFEPLPGGIVHVPFNDPAAIEAAFAEHDVVGVFAEAVQGEGGITPMSDDMAAAVRRSCHDADAILVVDEVQAGMGRTGRFFAYEHFGLSPDIVTLAKGLGGGLPIGATLVSDKVAASMGPGSHGSTFGGNPVACAAANAVLDVIAEEGLVAEAARKGAILRGALDGAGFAGRGLGLLVGVPAPGRAGPVVDAMRADGFLVGQAGQDTIRLAPALNVPDDDVVSGCQALARIVAPVQRL